MKTIEWNEGQRKAFQDLLREFAALIDAKMKRKSKQAKPQRYQSGLHVKEG